MRGDDRVRHCGTCNKNVYNLSAMAEQEAAALVARHKGGDLCVRFYRRADGTVMTSNCGARSRTGWRRLPGLAGVALVALAAAACGKQGDAQANIAEPGAAGPPQIVAGGMG